MLTPAGPSWQPWIITNGAADSAVSLASRALRILEGDQGPRHISAAAQRPRSSLGRFYHGAIDLLLWSNQAKHEHAASFLGVIEHLSEEQISALGRLRIKTIYICDDVMKIELLGGPKAK